MRPFTRRDIAALGAAFLCLPAYAQVSPTPKWYKGTITTGGVAQTVPIGAELARGWEVCNPDFTNDLWVDDAQAAVAGESNLAPAKGCYITPRSGDGRPTVLGPLSIVGAVTGQKFRARTW